MTEPKDWETFFKETGKRGGIARAAALTPRRRKAISRKAGKASAAKRQREKDAKSDPHDGHTTEAPSSQT